MPSTPRLASIDAFRALTMLLMIFVNDLWTLTGIPLWLEHTAAEADGMGLADVVFPAFLFIVGLSIPYAQPSLKRILIRSLALLVMGFFHVNLEHYHGLLPKPIWQIAMTIAFFLIWLDYKQQRIWLQISGVVILIALAILFDGWMQPHWWGILGLIGWSYLLSALIFLFSKGRLPVLIIAWFFFNLTNILMKDVWIVSDGALPAITMAGAVIGAMYKKGQHRLFLIIGIILIAAGFAIRPWEGISKIRATPAWVLICTGISILCFTGLTALKKEWFALIKPAGTSTLTAYLLPYIHYALYSMVGISLPLFLRTGITGIIKSLLYALLIIFLTGFLEKKKIRLKI